MPSGEGRRLIAGPGVYICESCIALLATPESTAATAERCSFCGRRDVPIAGAWPSLAICAACIELSHNILAEDDRRSRPAT
jgi:ATP-dependent protease Clp ATPase subunit